MTTITVLKLDHAGRETYRYSGRLVKREAHRLVLEAFFDREDTSLHGLILRTGDRFLETYFDDRWYNVFEIYDCSDGRLKGWYCNVGCPAEFHDASVSYRDLALDVLVFPDGRQVILDEEEFARLPLTPEMRLAARAALAELQEVFRKRPGKALEEDF